MRGAARRRLQVPLGNLVERARLGAAGLNGIDHQQTRRTEDVIEQAEPRLRRADDIHQVRRQPLDLVGHENAESVIAQQLVTQPEHANRCGHHQSLCTRPSESRRRVVSVSPFRLRTRTNSGMLPGREWVAQP